MLVFGERDQMSHGQLPRYRAIKIKIDFLLNFFLFDQSVVQYLFLDYTKYYIDLKSTNIFKLDKQAVLTNLLPIGGGQSFLVHWLALCSLTPYTFLNCACPPQSPTRAGLDFWNYW